MPTYTAAPEVERIGAGLIAKHHTRLADVAITYVFRDKASKSKGRVVAGKARKITGLNAWLANEDGDEFFVVEIAADEWENLGRSQRVALVDHELTHFTVEYDEETEEVTLGIKGHDVEEFAQVVERHGAWNDDLKYLVGVVEQLGLFGEDEDREADQ